jgi:hypothetical protein
VGLTCRRRLPRRCTHLHGTLTQVTEVKYPAYRQYLDQRQVANSAIMALLAGSQLASHSLRLTEGSDRTLMEIFPRVTHIGRFNLKTERAQQLLDDAEIHLSAMALPYILAVQESLFGNLETMLCDAGTLTPRRSNFGSPVWVVRDHWRSVGEQLDDSSWRIFELLIELRNDIIHRAGKTGPNLVTKAAALQANDYLIWQRMTRQQLPAFTLHQEHVLTQADAVACFAVVKFLAKESNEIIARRYPRAMWLTMLNDDAVANNRARGNANQRFRRLKSYVRLNYAALNFTDAELQAQIP